MRHSAKIFLWLAYAWLMGVLLWIAGKEMWRYYHPPKERTVQSTPFKPKPVVPTDRSPKMQAYDRRMAVAIAERDVAYGQCRKQGGIPVPGYEAVVCIYQYPNGDGEPHVGEAKIDWPSNAELKEALK